MPTTAPATAAWAKKIFFWKSHLQRLFHVVHLTYAPQKLCASPFSPFFPLSSPFALLFLFAFFIRSRFRNSRDNRVDSWHNLSHWCTKCIHFLLPLLPTLAVVLIHHHITTNSTCTILHAHGSVSPCTTQSVAQPILSCRPLQSVYFPKTAE